MPLAQDVGGARGRDLLVNNNKRCNCSINISNWTLKQDTWMYMVTNVMYYSIAIRLIQSLMHLSSLHVTDFLGAAIVRAR